MAEPPSSPCPSLPVEITFTPSSPFDDLTADTILCSSDGCDFHVHRAVLSRASAFFSDIEAGSLVDRFLRIWYPRAEMTVVFDGLEELDGIIGMALFKYDMEFVAPVLRNHLRRWVDIAKAAARESLKLAFSRVLHNTSCTPQLKHISAHHFQGLLRYHDACGVAASSAGRLLPWSDAKYLWIGCTSCEPHKVANTLLKPVGGVTRRVTPRAWIFQYLDEAGAALKDTPRANIQDISLLVKAQGNASACVFVKKAVSN
ncbi:hypothetical protein K438DRAFT_1998554 [Mycena galopus ATCC 62051]|nr:hypothetical protein K438DRAFT_1998554 [Mycena galopus ATCC 62051]